MVELLPTRQTLESGEERFSVLLSPKGILSL